MTELLSPSPWHSRPVPASALTTVLLGVIVVTALYFAREVLVPIALAVLMSFVLAPLVRLLQGLYVPRIAAVIVSVLVAFALVFSLAAMMVSQVNQLASDLPGYQSTLQCYPGCHDEWCNVPGSHFRSRFRPTFCGRE